MMPGPFCSEPEYLPVFDKTSENCTAHTLVWSKGDAPPQLADLLIVAVALPDGVSISVIRNQVVEALLQDGSRPVNVKIELNAGMLRCSAHMLLSGRSCGAVLIVSQRGGLKPTSCSSSSSSSASRSSAAMSSMYRDRFCCLPRRFPPSSSSCGEASACHTRLPR